MKPFHFRRFAFALPILGAALALSSCAPSNDKGDNVATPDANAKNATTDNATTDNATSDNAATESAVADDAVIDNAVADENAAPAPTSAVKFSYLETIYVPGQDDLLHAQKVSRMAIDSQLKSGGNGAPALQEIIEKAPQHFPPGAKVNDWKEDEKTVTVDLNAAFDKPEFWSAKGEKTTELAVYALVNSAAKTTGAQGKSASKPVKFTIAKAPAQSLGEFDVSGEIEPEMRLVAK